MSPKIDLQFNEFSFFFYAPSAESKPHVNAYTDNPWHHAQFWIVPEGFVLEQNKGDFSEEALNSIVSFLSENRERLIELWNQHLQ